MDLNEQKSGSKDEEEERMREESQTTRMRAFREYENRTNAPHSEGNTRRSRAFKGYVFHFIE